MTVLDFPTGSIVQSATLAIDQTGWIRCDGSTLNGTLDLYRGLWELIGTTYGGSGQSAFKIPHLGGRIPVGVKASTAGTGLDGPIGSWTGATQISLATTETGYPIHGHGSTWNAGNSTGDPGHGHTATSSAHTHSVGYSNQTVKSKSITQTIAIMHGGNPSLYISVAASTNVSLTSTTISNVSVSDSTTATGSPHTNIQPSTAIDYLIRL